MGRGTFDRSGRVRLALASIIGVALTLTLAGAAGAGQNMTVTVTGPGAGIDLRSMTYADARAALEAAADQPITIPNGPVGLAVDITNASLATPDGTHTLVIGGDATVLGQQGQGYLVARWAGDEVAGADVALLFRFDDVTLGALTGLPGIGVGFDSVWLGASADGPMEVTAVELSGLGTDLVVPASGVVLRGSVDPQSDLGTALSLVGVGGVTVQGSLSGSVDILGGGGVSGNMSLEAAVPIDHQVTPHVRLGGTFTLSLSLSNQAVVAGLDGTVTTTISGTQYSANGHIGITEKSGGVELTLAAGIGSIDDLFGASWLDLTQAEVQATISSTGEVTAGLSASVLVAGHTLDLSLGLGAGALVADLSAPDPVGARQIANAIAPGDPIPDQLDVSLSDLALRVRLGTGPQTGLLISGTATATLTIGGSSHGVAVLLRYDEPDLLFAARNTGDPLTLKSFGVDVDGVTLPDIAITVSTSKMSVDSDELDPPTRNYFAGLLCPSTNPDCDYRLRVGMGVGITGAIDLPNALKEAMAKIGFASEDRLVVSGLIPAFGGTKAELTVHLPSTTATPESTGVVRGTALELSFSTGAGQIETALKGTLTLGIGRSEDDGNCTGGQLAGPHGEQKCLDLVDFSITAAVSFGPSVSISITGSIDSEEGWEKPFGISWLTFHQATMTLGVTVSPPAFELGFAGRLKIDEVDLTVAIKVNVTPQPPFVVLRGFTGASQRGITMHDLAWLYEQVSGETVDRKTLPPLGVRNLFLSFGTETDEALCIRQGFFLSGELYIAREGDQPKGPTPQCLPPTNQDHPDAPDITEACKEDDDCLASILVDVDTGQGSGIPSVRAAGFVTGWSAGPLAFDPTSVELRLSIQRVRVFLDAGATLLDPVAHKLDPNTDKVWASGHLTLDVGTEKLLLDGRVQIGDIVNARVVAKGELNLSDPGFDLNAWLPIDKLKELGEKIEPAVEWAKQTSKDFVPVVVENHPDKLARRLTTTLNALQQPEPDWETVYNQFLAVEQNIAGINQLLSNFGLPKIPSDRVFWIMLHGYVTPDVPPVRVCVAGVCVTISQGVSIPNIPGACAMSWFQQLPGAGALCAASNVPLLVEEMKKQYVEHSIATRLSAGDVEVPDGATSRDVVTRFDELEASQGGQSGASSAQLTAKAQGEEAAIVEVSCGVSHVSYTEGTIGDTLIDIETMGATVTLAGPKPQDLGDGSELRQPTIDALVTGGAQEGCQPESASPLDPELLMSLSTPVVAEGSTVHASGRLIGATGEVTIDWGDGSIDQVTPGQDGRFQVGHAYVDGPASFQVIATADPDLMMSRGIVVANVAPTIFDVEVDPFPVDEMSEVTVSGTVTDPGVLDTQVVTIDWNDGTDPVTVEVSGGLFEASHVYQDDDPTGTPWDDVDVELTATDNDGGSRQTTAIVRVANVPPTDLVLEPSSSELVDAGTLFTHAGVLTDWTGSAHDVSPVDWLDVAIDWGEPGLDVQHVIVLPQGTAIREFDTAHGWGEPCLYEVNATVTDDDEPQRQDPAAAEPVPVVVTAPSGAQVYGSGWWTRQATGLVKPRLGSAFTIQRFGCYLAIVRHVTDSLDHVTNAGTAIDVLQPPPKGDKLHRERTKLQRALLTALLNFANGGYEWNQVVGSGPGTFGELVRAADTAAATQDVKTIMAMRVLLEQLVGS